VQDASRSEAVTTIFCPSALRELWLTPHVGEWSPLAKQWHQQYPGLFDEDDLRLTIAKGHWSYHFYEWYAAIRLFQRDGAVSMLEKYDSKCHRRKVVEFERVVSVAKRQILHKICSDFKVQLPDLLVLSADGVSFSFAEVKGPDDHTLKRKDQRGCRDAIREQLKVRVEIIKVCLVPS
jgi:hypothetical protein